jgi:hypothetical protein
MHDRRPFLVWVGDVLCGLAAYVLSRWIWKSVGTGPFDQLLEELATFAAVFVLLKVLWRGLTRRRKPA